MSNFEHPELQRLYDVAIRGAWNHPFFLIPLGHLEWVISNDPKQVPTMSVLFTKEGRGIRLYVNPEWSSKLPDDEAFGVLCHEILHPLLQHAARAEGKNFANWAKATDMAINASLVSSGIKIPSVGLMPPREHMESSAEEIYAGLEDESIPQPKGFNPDTATAGCMPSKAPPQQGGGEGDGDQDGQGGGGQGDGDGQDGQGGGGYTDQPDPRFFGEMAAQAAQMSRGTGSAQAIARLLKPRETKIKWEKLLRRTASQAQARGGRDEASYRRSNRRSGDVILPGHISKRPAIAVAIDTSGSVSDEMLRASISNVKKAADASGVRFFLALHDGACYWSGWVNAQTSVEQLSSLCNHRGGTDPAEAFEAVNGERAKFDALVYMTDGEVGTYPDKPINVKRVIVGIVGEHQSSWRAKVPDGWTELLVDVEPGS